MLVFFKQVSYTCKSYLVCKVHTLQYIVSQCHKGKTMENEAMQTWYNIYKTVNHA